MRYTAFHAGSTGSNPVPGTAENRSSRRVSPTVSPTSGVRTSTLLACFVLLVVLLGGPEPASAEGFSITPPTYGAGMLRGAASQRPSPFPRFLRGIATWYGPGFYGRRTACRQKYSIRIRGVAHNHGDCGDRFTICHRSRCVRVVKIDTGGFSHAFDLSARTAMDLCRCSRPYTMTVNWRKGWS